MKRENISPHNILFMLAYAFDMRWDYLENEIDNDQIEELSFFELLVFVLVKWTELLLKRIPLRRYLLFQESTTRLKGKILFKEMINNSGVSKAELDCEFDELSFDADENRILLSTLILAASQLGRVNSGTSKSDNREGLRKSCNNLIRRFEPHVTFKTLNRRLFDCLSFNRLNQHYEPLIEVCWFIFTTLNIYQQGDGKFFDIADDKLSKLFENFLRNYLAQSLSEDGYVVSASQVNHWLITPEGERPRYMPSIKPDIVIKRKGRVEFVIDAKFYKTPVHASHVGKTDNNETEARQKTHSHNLYQIIAYTSYFNCDGLLVYAQTDSGFFYEMVTINKKNYPGNIIETPYFGFYTLSLSGEFEQFKKRLKEFVDTIVLAQISA